MCALNELDRDVGHCGRENQTISMISPLREIDGKNSFKLFPSLADKIVRQVPGSFKTHPESRVEYVLQRAASVSKT